MKFDPKKVAELKAVIRKSERQLVAAENATASAHKAFQNCRSSQEQVLRWRAYTKLDEAEWTIRDRIARQEMQLLNYLMQFASSNLRRWVKDSMA